MRVRLKVCCISSLEEAKLAIDAGADALGLVGDMPSGPGIISDDLITEIARATPPPVSTFLLTSETTADQIAKHAIKTGVDTIQLVDHIALEEYPKLRAQLTSQRLVQVIHVEDESAIEIANRYATVADALLLDSGRPSAVNPELGGTGRTHNWQLSSEIVKQSPVPVFLAGGLNAQNVADAVWTVNPFGVDLCSSLRNGTALDSEKLHEFSSALHRA